MRFSGLVLGPHFVLCGVPNDAFFLAILQRVLSASVAVDGKIVSQIGKGVLVLAAMAPGDTEKEADSLAAKVLKLKLWDDDSGGRVGFLPSLAAMVSGGTSDT